jgi:ABC-type transporter Mla MlaB component
MDTLVLVVTGPVARETLPTLCERFRVLLESNEAEVIVCDVSSIEQPDAETMEAVARLQLTALRMGRRVRFLDASGDLRYLLALSGLSGIVPCDELPLESRRQPE